MNAPTPLPEDDPEPQQPPRSTKEQETAFDTSRLEVDALRAMLNLPQNPRHREAHEGDPEQPTR